MSTRPEPVLVLDAIKAIVAVAAGFGWVAVDDPVISTSTTAAAAVIYLVLTLITRARVTPLADPRDQDGLPLVSTGRHARPDQPTDQG